MRKIPWFFQAHCSILEEGASQLALPYERKVTLLGEKLHRRLVQLHNNSRVSSPSKFVSKPLRAFF